MSEIDDLRAKLRQWDYEYYVRNAPSVSDRIYDQHFERLKQLETQHPELITPDSPTQRVGSDTSSDFPEVRHTIPVLSLDKAYSPAEILAWTKRCLGNLGSDRPGLRVSAEEKIDGLSLVLYYRGGLLERALTRGNGETGNDITANVRTIRDVPLRLSQPLDAVFRGEVYIRKDDFKRLNHDLEVPYSNPRNFAAGSLRRVKSSEVARIPLRLFVYEGAWEGSPATHAQTLSTLLELGFRVNQRTIHLTLPAEQAALQAWIDAETRERSNLEYEIDGLVLKVDDAAARTELGFTGHHPRWAIAYKFDNPQGISKVLSIDVQVGRTGRVTPVARIEPVEISGSTIQNVTLHNQEYIDGLELAPGDTVQVSRRGDVIPAIESVLEKGPQTQWKMPGQCPTCNTPVVRRGAHDFCPNFDCPDRQLGRLSFFVARDQMNIEGLGPETILFLRNQGFVKDIPDLYDMDWDVLLRYDGWGEKKVEKLKKSIAESTSVPFVRVLPSLGLNEIGPKFTELLIQNGYRSIQAMYDLIDREEVSRLLEIKGVGERLIASFVQELSTPRLRSMVQRLAGAGLRFVHVESDSQQSTADASLPQIFAGQVWCVTGTFESYKPRSLAMTEILRRGGVESSDVTKTTTHLLVGQDAGSKLAKAQKFGITIVDEAGFLALLASAAAKT